MHTHSPITDVIFDFCGVLIDWQSRACLEGHFPQTLVDDICAPDDPYGFFHYEDRMDAGESFASIIDDYRNEYGNELAAVFTYYIDHYEDSLPRLFPGTEQLLEDLHEASVGVWGLTNWSFETIHTAYDRFPQLEDLLDGTVVSGVEKMHKPNADIYECTLERFHLQAPHCLFFDDTMKNVEGAHQVGIEAFHFISTAQARADIISCGVPIPTRDAFLSI